MSQKFIKFVERVAKDNEFKPLRNQLLNYLQKESEHKYKNYPRLLELMEQHWPKYKDGSRISYLLRDHYEEIFYFYLNTLFPFRKRGLNLLNPEAPTPVDFKLEYHYKYNLGEIKAVEVIMDKLKIEGKVFGLSTIMCWSGCKFAEDGATRAKSTSLSRISNGIGSCLNFLIERLFAIISSTVFAIFSILYFG